MNMTHPLQDLRTTRLLLLIRYVGGISVNFSDSCRCYFFSLLVKFPGSFHGLFIHSARLVCHKLIHSWKADLNTSLAGLELPTSLARMRIADHGTIAFAFGVEICVEFKIMSILF